jgi:hypothetical protein
VIAERAEGGGARMRLRIPSVPFADEQQVEDAGAVERTRQPV